MGANNVDGGIWITACDTFALDRRSNYIYGVSHMRAGAIVALFIYDGPGTSRVGSPDRRRLHCHRLYKEQMDYFAVVAFGFDNIRGWRSCRISCLLCRTHCQAAAGVTDFCGAVIFVF